MKISQNELSGLCRRVFEALGYSPGDHEDAADMVVWLEQHGLGGIDTLWHALDHFASEPRPPMRRVFDDSSLTVIDAAGNSVLVCGSLAADLACAKARHKGLAIVRIQHCFNRKLMLGHLARCARRGINLLAFWRDSESPDVIEQVVSIRAWQSNPTLLRYRIRDHDERLTRNRSVTLVASPHFAMLQSLHPDPVEATLLEELRPEDFERQSQLVWSQGLTVDDTIWWRLKELAARTLVESSEASRNRGAGEGA